VVNQDRDDVTVVRAATTPLNLDMSRCERIDLASVDCTEALAQGFQAPSFHRVMIGVQQDISRCALLRVTTASKNAGLANSLGIGFWSSQAAEGNQAAEDAGRFTPRSELKAVGTATLRSGAPATLHEFVGVANCPASGAEVLRLFKPYMEFQGSDGTHFRNWDLASNYRISPSVRGFDRSADVLRP
jgi:hypothetical protein